MSVQVRFVDENDGNSIETAPLDDGDVRITVYDTEEDYSISVDLSPGEVEALIVDLLHTKAVAA